MRLGSEVCILGHRQNESEKEGAWSILGKFQKIVTAPERHITLELGHKMIPRGKIKQDRRPTF